eukprot:134101-Chlamydomonas_euryale.AAC.1
MDGASAPSRNQAPTLYVKGLLEQRWCPLAVPKLLIGQTLAHVVLRLPDVMLRAPAFPLGE